MPEISPLMVKGTPVPYQENPKNRENPETTWRKEIEKEVQKLLQISPDIRELIEQVKTSLAIPQFAVEITFIVNNPVDRGKDIDNLSKPVLDTLFYASPNNTPEPGREKPTGVLFREMSDKRIISDSYVCHMVAHKRRPAPDEEEQAVIRVSWP